MTAGERTPTQKRFVSVGNMSALRNATNTPRRRRGSCKCLFGAPDRDDTRRMLSEQYARDRKRIIRRFNFDIETECAYKAARLDSPTKFFEADKENEESTPIRTATEALAGLASTDLRLGSPSRRHSPRTPAKSSPRTPRSPLTPRTPRTPRSPASRRQLHMTDYWTIRKCAESSSDKEN